MKNTDWFKDWFNTPYYHILYKNRNLDDAKLFMRNITNHLELSKTSHILDLPCGKGRHSIYLNSLGYNVTGADLSENSIHHAKKFENEHLKFKMHDMRIPLDDKYDAIFNLFTSFGYFDDDKIDLLILKNIKNGLKENGFFVFDFLNATKVKSELVKSEIKTIDEIIFNITRKIINGFILKQISFHADGKNHLYTEKVKYLDFDKIKMYLEHIGLTIIDVFGDYYLNKFDNKTSNRLIVIAK